jgi:hypothetical protein
MSKFTLQMVPYRIVCACHVVKGRWMIGPQFGFAQVYQPKLCANLEDCNERGGLLDNAPSAFSLEEDDALCSEMMERERAAALLLLCSIVSFF